MLKPDPDKLFGYAFTFIEMQGPDVHRSGDLTYRERAEIQRLADGKLAGAQKVRMLRLVAEKPVALRYLGALLRNNDRCERAL